MPWSPPARRAAVFGALYAALGLAFRPQRWDGSGLTYAVLSDLGGGKAHAAAHVLYLPVLRAWLELLRFLGFAGAAVSASQALSALAGGVFAALAFRLGERWSGDRRAALAAACVLVFDPHVWCYGLQSKPYSIASALALGFFLVLTAPGRLDARRGALAGLAAGLATGFDAMSLSLVAVIWAWAALRPKARDRNFLLAFHGVYAAIGVLYAASLSGGPFATFTGMYDAQGIVDGVLAGAPLGEQLLSYGRWTALQMGGLLVLAPALLLLLARPSGALGRARLARAAALGGALLAARAAVSLAFHAEDDFVHAAWLAAVPAAAVLLRRREAATGAAAFAAALIAAQSFSGRVEPLSRPESAPVSREADFLARTLGGGTLVVAGAPDWSVLQAMENRGGPRILRLDGAGRYAPLGERVDPGALAAALAASPAWIAGDSFYRPEGLVPRARIDAFQDEAARALARGVRFGPELRSPNGQRYRALLPAGTTVPRDPRARPPRVPEEEMARNYDP